MPKRFELVSDYAPQGDQQQAIDLLIKGLEQREKYKVFFPNNAVEYFISYYDYYQPEAYLPSSDTYIEKETSVNDNIDKLRLRATSSLLERNDVIIVASVSS